MASSMLHTSFEMSMFLFIAFLGFFIAQRLRQPTTVVNIILGIMIGPSVLDLIKYDQAVEALAHIGAIFLIFTAGLQYKGHHIYTNQNILVALGGILVPWLIGFGVTQLFFDSITAIFVATTLTATSIAVSVGILEEYGILKKKFARIIIGAALVDDILGLLALSMTQSFMVSGFDGGEFMLRIGSSLLFLTGAVLLGPTLSKLTTKVHNWAKKRDVHHLTFLFAITIAFLYGMLAEVAGLSAVIGAFLAGFILERLNFQDFKIGAQYMQIVFSAIFFMSIGMLVRVTISKKILLLVLFLTVLAALTKIVGCGVCALFTKTRPVNALKVGIAMVPRGEVAMITALAGLNLGALTNDMYSSLILMAVGTCLITPLLLRPLLYKKKKVDVCATP